MDTTALGPIALYRAIKFYEIGDKANFTKTKEKAECYVDDPKKLNFMALILYISKNKDFITARATYKGMLLETEKQKLLQKMYSVIQYLRNSYYTQYNITQ